MALFPEHSYDIFVSYCHYDNEADGGRWVNSFVNKLEYKLRGRLERGGLLNVWWDKELQGNQDFNDLIKDTLNQTTIFLALVSPRYLDSEYCQKELNWFFQKAKNQSMGLTLGDYNRIVNVCLYNVQHEKWPIALQGATGFRFYEAKNKRDKGDPLNPRGSPFKYQLSELLNALEHMFEENITSHPSQNLSQNLETEETEIDVFLATVEDNLKSTRNRLKTELISQGLKVHRGTIPPPDEPDEHERAVIPILKNSKLSVHLLNDKSGRQLDEETSYIQKQALLGLDHANSQIVWIPRHLEITTIKDVRQKEFLEQLETDSRGETGYHFIKGLPSNLNKEITIILKQLNYTQTTDFLPPAVLLDVHYKDTRLVRDISDFLLKKNIMPYINPAEDDPKKNINLLIDRLRRVKMVVIFFGHVGMEWVRSRLDSAINLVFSEKCPVKTFCIYLAPPKEGKLGSILPDYPWVNLDILDNIDGFNESSISSLLSRIDLPNQL